MAADASSFDAQKRGWATLKSLRPTSIDLSRVDLIRRSTTEQLSDRAAVERLLLQLGLNDEGLDELPNELHGCCGGLHVWQYPTQFSRYLVRLSQVGVRSYLEIGVRHGGSFVATVEFLDRFAPLDCAIAVDIIDCPSMARYMVMNPRARFWHIDSRSSELSTRLDALGGVDLAFIDSHHEEAQCRDEVARLLPRANMIALHDIANVRCPGIGRVWHELTQLSGYEHFEFVEQYDERGPFMGIGLLVRRDRMEVR
jgi:methyltransferase family protein